MTWREREGGSTRGSREYILSSEKRVICPNVSWLSSFVCDSGMTKHLFSTGMQSLGASVNLAGCTLLSP